MTWTDGLMIAATFLGPIAAVQAQKWVERWRDQERRRLDVFKTLMATRATVLSPTHVQALNSIEMEFTGARYAPVRKAWKVYLDHLNDGPKGPAFEDEAAINLWVSKNPQLLSELLVEMGQTLGYRFDEVDVKRGIYNPIGHAKDENEQRHLRALFTDVLEGKSALSMRVESMPQNEAVAVEYKQMIRLLRQALDSGALAVSVRDDNSAK